jgi:hypothetical protein
VLVGFFVLITAVSLLMPSRVMSAQTVMINAPNDKVFQAIHDFDGWRNWHPLFMQVPQTVSIVKQQGNVEQQATWLSGGKENRLLMKSATAQQVHVLLQRNRENDLDNLLSVMPITGAPGVQVEWRVQQQLKWYPWEKFSGIFFNQLVGPGNQQALESLKVFCERP